MKKTLALSLLLLLGAGCFKHSYTVGTGGNTGGSAAYSKWHSHWLWGLVGDDNVNVKAVCPSGNATIVDEHSFFNLVIASLVGVIWWPTSVEVYCDGGTARVLIPAETLRRLGRDPRLEGYVKDIAPELADRLSWARDQDAQRPQVAER